MNRLCYTAGVMNPAAHLASIPAVEKLLHDPEIAPLIDAAGREAVTSAVRRTLGDVRVKILAEDAAADIQVIRDTVRRRVEAITEPALRRVVNATGVLLHTNLGRAPMGAAVMREVEAVATGYSDLELDRATGRRGRRHESIAELIRVLTGAEDAIVVNNNAAAVYLCLNTLAPDAEVVISRGELIEIGGAFRMPDIMAASGARMVEVGATNRTRLADYEEAVGDNTKIILKAHQSNYAITGFTEEVGLAELAGLAKSRGLVFLYDQGSGLLRPRPELPLPDEPDVRRSLEAGADLVTFSCDKLLGGPQAGIVAGRRDLIAKLSSTPLMRAFRVGKMTLAALSAALRLHLRDETLSEDLPLYALLHRGPGRLRELADELRDRLDASGVRSEVVAGSGRCGGGALPQEEFESSAVALAIPEGQTAEQVFRRLLEAPVPVLGALREGRLHFDLFSVMDESIPELVETVRHAVCE